DLLGGVVQIASRRGGDKFALGVQGVVPRPRFASPGFGRLEGIFPRVHASGPAAHGDVHYMAAVEYDFERIPVPQVTQGQGPDITPHGSGTTFLSPSGWRGNWFSTLTRQASRVAAIVTFERTAVLRGKTHDFTFGGRLASRRVSGRITNTPVAVEDLQGRTVRS